MVGQSMPNGEILKCLDVGLRVCYDGDYSHYVDDIHGVNDSFIRDMKEDDRQSLSSFFKNKKQFAYTQFLKDLEIEFSKYKKFNHIVSETLPFQIGDRKAIVETRNNLQGFWYRMPYHQLIDYTINSINLFSTKRLKVNVVVLDLFTGESLLNQVYIANIGINKIVIDLVISNEVQKSLFVGISTDELGLISVSCGDFKDNCNCMEDSSMWDYAYMNKCESYTEDGLFIDCDITKAFCLDATIKCNFERIVCLYKDFFIDAYAHKLAWMLLVDKVTTSRRGWYLDSGIEDLKKETIPFVYHRYKELLELSVKNTMGITDDNICWECDANGSSFMMTTYV